MITKENIHQESYIHTLLHALVHIIWKIDTYTQIHTHINKHKHTGPEASGKLLHSILKIMKLMIKLWAKMIILKNIVLRLKIAFNSLIIEQ